MSKAESIITRNEKKNTAIFFTQSYKNNSQMNTKATTESVSTENKVKLLLLTRVLLSKKN